MAFDVLTSFCLMVFLSLFVLMIVMFLVGCGGI